ncbi:hypothetical protein AM571_PC00859 (plasmid) [Rhizobium etli 8C-3]|uniref:Uncharacterized protein n=1 Tax=Rhizobium etli 8C-3 TaxID=538025 RepID=A0A1L5PF50_RHIET|nr:hypothetical protein AM571_PC00859 [Rhizobium etli 8C-3]
MFPGPDMLSSFIIEAVPRVRCRFTDVCRCAAVQLGSKKKSTRSGNYQAMIAIVGR